MAGRENDPTLQERIANADNLIGLGVSTIEVSVEVLVELTEALKQANALIEDLKEYVRV